MGRLKRIVSPRTPETTPQKSQRRSPRLSSTPGQATKKPTPQRRRRKSSVATQDIDVIEITRKSFDARAKPVKKITQPQKPVALRRSTIDEAVKLGTHILFLFVGTERTPTTLHTNLLSASVVVALQELHQHGFIVLETHSLESVELYRVWLYTGKLCPRVPDEEGEEAEEIVLADREWARLAHAYILGVS